jgi:hypothetical protein
MNVRTMFGYVRTAHAIAQKGEAEMMALLADYDEAYPTIDLDRMKTAADKLEEAARILLDLRAIRADQLQKQKSN